MTQSALVSLILVILMVLPTGMNLQAVELPNFHRADSSESDPAANLYKLYFVEPGQNQTAGMDGLISTQPPASNADQVTASALDDDVQFMSISMMSTLELFGRKFFANETHYVPVELFLKSEGPQNSNVDWTVSIMTTERTLGSTTYSGSVCTASFGSSCDLSLIHI